MRDHPRNLRAPSSKIHDYTLHIGEAARDPKGANFTLIFLRQYFYDQSSCSFDSLAEFGRVDSRACGFGSNDADAVTGDAEIRADNLEA